MICTQRERSEPSIYIYRKQILEELKKKKAQPSSLSLGEVSVGDVLTVTRLLVSVRTHSAMRPVLHGAGRAARTQKHSVLFLTCCAARRRGVGDQHMSGGWPRLFTASGPGPRRRRAPGHPRTPPGAWLPGPRPSCRRGGRFRGDAVCRGAVLAPPGAQARVGRPCSRAHPAQTSVPAAVVGAVTAPESGARCGLLNADREARERVLCEEAGRVGVVSRQSSDPSTSSRCSD